jgi:hypothetical protein
MRNRIRRRPLTAIPGVLYGGEKLREMLPDINSRLSESSCARLMRCLCGVKSQKDMVSQVGRTYDAGLPLRRCTVGNVTQLVPTPGTYSFI